MKSSRYKSRCFIHNILSLNRLSKAIKSAKSYIEKWEKKNTSLSPHIKKRKIFNHKNKNKVKRKKIEK